MADAFISYSRKDRHFVDKVGIIRNAEYSIIIMPGFPVLL